MGLIRALALSEEPGGCAIVVRIGLTEPGCLMGASFAAQARERLEGLPGVSRVEVELDHSADWQPSDIDQSYRDRLEVVRRARRRALSRTLASGPHAGAVPTVVSPAPSEPRQCT
jgi:metal-sulfur cluster biosynthetic enzyme